MHRYLFVAAAFIGFLVAPAAWAQSAEKYVYSAIDEVSVTGNSLIITGVILGQPAPSSQEYFVPDFSSTSGAGALQNCMRLATLAMVKPGAFLFSIVVEGWNYPVCTLSRSKP